MLQYIVALCWRCCCSDDKLIFLLSPQPHLVISALVCLAIDMPDCGMRGTMSILESSTNASCGCSGGTFIDLVHGCERVRFHFDVAHAPFQDSRDSWDLSRYSLIWFLNLTHGSAFHSNPDSTILYCLSLYFIVVGFPNVVVFGFQFRDSAFWMCYLPLWPSQGPFPWSPFLFPLMGYWALDVVAVALRHFCYYNGPIVDSGQGLLHY